MKIIRCTSLALSAGCLSLGMAFFAPTQAMAGCKDSAAAEVDWSGCRKRNLILSGYDMSGGNFNKTDFFGSDMRETKFVGANLSRATLTRANVSNSDLSNADMSKVDGGRSVFQEVNLANSSLEKAELFRADFSGSNLSNTNLNKTEMGRANFQNSDLSGAQITFTNLARANFSGAKLAGADFEKSWTYLTQFEDVDLTEVLNLSQEQLELACGNADTKLPAGLVAPAKWPCGSDD